MDLCRRLDEPWISPNESAEQIFETENESEQKAVPSTPTIQHETVSPNPRFANTCSFKSK